MIVGVPQETYPDERRVAIVPGVVAALAKKDIQVVIEAGAGTRAGFLDAAYLAAGAKVEASRDEVFKSADVIAQVRTLGANEDAGKDDLARLREGQIVIGYSEPLTALDAAKTLADKKVLLFSMEMVPRITRAQSMDSLSSQATVAGYKAVLLAANELSKMCPMMMTAAGTIKPAHFFIVGAGVAGLQAISSARRLGAVVEAYDVRPVVKEQVESLGAKFVEMELDTGSSESKGGYAKEQNEEFYKKQREMMTKVVSESDVVITTAAIPGRKAPILITDEMVAAMSPGSIVLDLAAERGGNCAATKPGETITLDNGVVIMGPVNVPSMLPYHASQMYSKNVATFLMHLAKDGKPEIDREDEITSGMLVTFEGKITHPMVLERLESNQS